MLDWASPEISARRAATGSIVSRALPASPVGVVAVMVTAPRFPLPCTVATVPTAVTVASDASLDVHASSRFVTGLPAASVPTAVSTASTPACTGMSVGVTAIARAVAPGPTYSSVIGGGGAAGSVNARAVTSCARENSTRPLASSSSISALNVCSVPWISIAIWTWSVSVAPNWIVVSRARVPSVVVRRIRTCVRLIPIASSAPTARAAVGEKSGAIASCAPVNPAR